MLLCLRNFANAVTEPRQLEANVEEKQGWRRAVEQQRRRSYYENQPDIPVPVRFYVKQFVYHGKKWRTKQNKMAH